MAVPLTGGNFPAKDDTPGRKDVASFLFGCGAACDGALPTNPKISPFGETEGWSSLCSRQAGSPQYRLGSITPDETHEAS